MTAATAPGTWLFRAVQADPELAGLLGERFYPDMPEQAVAYPQALYEITDGESQANLKSGDGGALQLQVSIQIWAESHLQAERIKGRMIEVFDKMRGYMQMSAITSLDSSHNAPERQRNFASFTASFFYIPD